MKNNKKAPQKKSNMLLGIVAVLVIAIAVFTNLNYKDKEDDKSLTKQPTVATVSATNENGDMVIPIADITENASFYSYDKLDAKMEVIAVKATDGTIRTAFNTCQVCYSSGRGYYVQEGNFLICQNCGNRFNMDEVEVTKGGCNPVPIFEDAKEVNDTSIIISKALFEEAEGIFANWKR